MQTDGVAEATTSGVLCSAPSCHRPAKYAVQVGMPHGMGHALCCDEHGPHPGDRNGVVGVETYLQWTNTQPLERAL